MLLFDKSQLHATNPGKIMDLRLLLTYRLHAKNIFGINNAASVEDCIRSAIHKLPSWLCGWRTKIFKRLFKFGGQLFLAVRADNVPYRKPLSRHVIVGLWNGGWLPVLGHFSSIPRSRHDPKILWVDDAEIVGDRITKVRPIPRNLFTQKTERRIGELGTSCVALVVSDVSVHEAP